ncbi:MAG: S24/S26 family peptidase [Nitrospirae bacterium]|nr:S24/S26 family peptidase [Nitrospirota bacterium]
MEPVIPYGTRLLVDTRPATIEPGDVLCFRDAAGPHLIVHRVIGRYRWRGTLYLVQAPERGGPARVVTPDRVIGLVREIPRPTGGTCGDFRRPLRPRERRLALRAWLRYLLGQWLRRRLPRRPPHSSSPAAHPSSPRS